MCGCINYMYTIIYVLYVYGCGLSIMECYYVHTIIYYIHVPPHYGYP